LNNCLCKGAGASVEDTTRFDVEAVKTLAGNRFDQAMFDKLKGEDGCISSADLASAADAPPTATDAPAAMEAPAPRKIIILFG
jgi:hypothetical protein